MTSGEGPYCYDYPRPAVTVDLVVFAWVEREVRVLLIRRRHPPFAGHWALPGGFLDMEERAAEAAVRELREETGLADPGPVAFLGVYDEPRRDPRGRTISLAHAAVTRGPVPHVQAGDDAAEAAWLHPIWLDQPREGERVPIMPVTTRLAFDHDRILTDALGWLAHGVWKGTLGVDLLPDEFTTEELRTLLMETTGRGASRDAKAWLTRAARAGHVAAQPARGLFAVVNRSPAAGSPKPR